MKRHPNPSRPAGRSASVATRQLAGRLTRLRARPGFVLCPLALAALVLTQGANALPTGLQTVVGSSQVTQDGNAMTVTTGTQKTIINTQTFGIAAQERLNVNQPGTTSSTMFNVLGYDPSYILGQLQSNGRVFLQNPNGIVFGQNARVDVGGMVATTMQLSNADFLAGRYQLSAGSNGHGDLAGRIINQGTINAPGGVVVLAGGDVTNSGQITAEGGRVGLIAASKVLVDVEGDGLLFFQVEGSEAGARLQQLGSIQADGGSVELMAAARGQFADTVLNMSGVVQARTLGMKEGHVVIDGGSAGATLVSGGIDVSGSQAGQRGGSVSVLGDKVGLVGTAHIDASGDAGGGTVLVGGNVQGSGTERQASATYVGQGVSIDASAKTKGDGGKVVVWSTGATRYEGQITARGGLLGGNGGFAEVSGHQHLDYWGAVDLSAPAGKLGTLLLDPSNIQIVATAAEADVDGNGTTGDDLSSSNNTGSATNFLFNESTGSPTSVSKISAVALVNQLNNSNVTLQAGHDITVGANVDASSNANSHALLLQAGSGSGDEIILSANITIKGDLNLQGNAIRLTATDVSLDAGAGKITLGAAVDGGTGNLTLKSTSTGADAISTSGAIGNVAALQVTGKSTLGGNVTTTGNQTYSDTVKLSATTTTLDAGSAKISLAGVDGSSKSLTLKSTSTDADAIKTSGAIGSVAALTVTGKSTLGANVTTTGNQSYTDTVTLGAATTTLDAGSGKIALASLDGGASNATLKSASTDADAIKTSGTISNVAVLNVTGKSTLGGNVTTTGNQTYSDTVKLSANATFDAGSGKIALASLDGGTNSATLKSTNTGADAISTSGTVSNVAALNVTGKSTLGGNVTTTGNQTYSDTVKLSATTTTLDAGSAKIALSGVDGNTKSLTLKSTSTDADAIKTSGAIGSVAALTVTGKSTLGANVTTTGNQSYSDTVTLGAATTTLDAGGAKIALTSLDGGANNATLKSTSTNADAISTSGAIGNVAALQVTGKSTLGGNVTTTGNQTYSDTVKLGTNATLDAGSAKIALSGVDGNTKSLTLKSTSTDADAIKTSGAIGSVAALTVTGKSTLGANVTTTGNQSYTDTVTLGTATTTLDAGSGKIALASLDGGANNATLKSTSTDADAIKTSGTISNVTVLNVTGKSTLGANVTTTGNQSYSDTVTLGAATTTLDAGSGKIALASLDGGTNSATLKSTNTGADAISTSGTVSNVAALNVMGKSTLGGNVTTTGNQTYSDSVKLGTSATLDAGAAKVALSSVDGNAKDLTLKSTNAAADAIQTNGAVSNVATLKVGGNATLAADVTTTGDQTYASAVTLAGADATRTLTGANIGLSTVAGGGKNLTLAASNTATLSGTITGVATLDTTGSANTALNTDVSATTQRYGAATIGGADATRTLTGTDVQLAGVTGNSKNLTVVAGNVATLGGPVAGVNQLTATGTNGVKVGADITTAGAQVYNGNVQLIGAARFTAPSLTFNNALDAGSFNIGLLTRNWIVGGILGTGGALTGTGDIQISTDVAGQTIGVLGGAGDLSIAQTDISKLTSAGFHSVTIGADNAGAINVGTSLDVLTLPTSLTFQSGSSLINVQAAINGAHDLTVKTGGGVTLGGTVNVASLTVDAGSAISVAGNVTTTGNQTYTQSITLGAAPVELATAGATSKIALQGGVDGNGQNFTLTNTANAGVTDAVSVGGTVSNVNVLAVNGNAKLSGDVSNIGTASVSGNAVVTGNVSNVNTLVVFGDASLGGTVNAGALGVGGNTTLGGNVTTTGSQNYVGGTTLANAVELKTSGVTSLITLQGAVNGQGNNLTLTNTANAASNAIQAGSTVTNVATLTANGNATLSGNVTNVNALNINGNAVLGGAANTIGAVAVTGATSLGGNVTSTGSQTYTGTTTLANAVELKTTGAAAKLMLQGAVLGNGQNLTLTNTTNTTDADAIKTGSAISNVAALKVDGKVTLGGNVSTTGNQAYTQNVTVASGSAMNLQTSGATAKLDVQGAVDGGGQNLTLTNTANTADADAIHLSRAVTNVATFTANGKTTLGGDVTSTGSQIYTNTLTLAADTVHLKASSVSLQQLEGANNALAVNAPGGLDFNGPINALRGLTVQGGGLTRFLSTAGLTTTSDQSYDGNVQVSGDATFAGTSISMAGTLIGAHNLTLNANQLNITGQLAGTGELIVAPTSAGTTIGLNGAAGTVQLDLSKVSGFTQQTIGSATSGSVRANAITLDRDTIIKTNGQALFDGTVNGAHALNVNAAVITTFNANVGDASPLTTLTVSGATQFNATTLRTSGAQNYLGNFVATQPLALTASTVNLKSDHDIDFSGLNLAAGGSILTKGVLTLSGDVNLTGGTLVLTSQANPTAIAFNDPEWAARNDLSVNNLALKEASPGIKQTGGVINTSVGTTLNLQASKGASIWVDHAENNLNGNLIAVSGTAGDTDPTRFKGTGTFPIGYVRVDANQIHSAGIEGDAVKLTANSLNTVAGTKIRARLPYVNAQGTETSLPALTLVPKTPTQFNLFGSGPSSTWIQVDVGDAAGGYVTVRTKGLGSGSSAIFLGGPDAPVPFYDGTGKISEIQIYYNGMTPSTPQEVGALSAVTAVIEDSRRSRFEEVVRTENVSARLRTGVIAEVGSGRPATVGTESIRMPQSCTPTNGLGC